MQEKAETPLLSCRLQDSTRRRKGHGQPGSVHHPRLFLPAEDDIPPDESHGVYRSKDGKNEKTFDALERLAAMPACACPHADRYSQVPNKAEQMVRYYGYYSNVSSGERKKEGQDTVIPSILEPDGSMKLPAASCGVSSFLVAVIPCLTQPAPYLIRGNPVGFSGYRLSPV